MEHALVKSRSKKRKKVIKEKNPIAIKIYTILKSGYTTKEKICVGCDIKFPTFNNVLTKPTISENIRYRLKHGGIINDDDITKYRVWCADHGLKT